MSLRKDVLIADTKKDGFSFTLYDKESRDYRTIQLSTLFSYIAAQPEAGSHYG